MNKINKYSKDEVNKILNESKSFREVLHRFGYNSNGSGGYATVKSHLKKLNILIPKYHYYGDGGSIKKIPLKDILIKNSVYTSRQSLKRRLINEKMLEYKCKNCGNEGKWNNENLSLQLEHINGINNDNRLENLCFLCPNCHSQTKTFSGKNKNRIKKENKVDKRKIHKPRVYSRKVNRPSYIDLIQDIEKLGYCGTGRKYGVSDNSIRKWIKWASNQS